MFLWSVVDFGGDYGMLDDCEEQIDDQGEDGYQDGFVQYLVEFVQWNFLDDWLVEIVEVDVCGDGDCGDYLEECCVDVVDEQWEFQWYFDFLEYLLFGYFYGLC